MLVLFPDPGSSWEQERAELFWWSQFRDGFRSMATQAAACPSGGDGSGGGGTPKLILLSMEWRHTTKVQVELCEPPRLQRKFLSSARVY